MSNKSSLIARLESYFNHLWYDTDKGNWLLLPFSGLFYLFSNLRRLIWQLPSKENPSLPVPVIVVGNLTVGGSGKTPLIIALCDQLVKQGYRPGVVSRGYKSTARVYPYLVNATDNPAVTGDEPLLIARRTLCPVAIAPDRYAAAISLLSKSNVNIILSDDGLQHYGLPRDIEIIVVDGQRGFGNGKLLPSGPLRESVSTLHAQQLLVFNGDGSAAMRLGDENWSIPPNRRSVYSLQPIKWVNAETGEEVSCAEFTNFLSSHQKDNTAAVHAIAGIGNPQRFFDTLTTLGMTVMPHFYGDHADFQLEDFDFPDRQPVVMTEKDAMKIQVLLKDRTASVKDRQFWYLQVGAELKNELVTVLNQEIALIVANKQANKNDHLH